ncbi:uncharacterized protein LOC120655610 isoform X4 [Panicum virgatum]|uniref:Uncharacterized protein n=1 Tax=Panicum virgatum TaxID=38727 RepID=A0A8T0WS18_PANVG|nr:uncharacterized protein LOC120655610 isoform X4 [Panicum virgatum]KAG2650640.1 hypothetical protein PVAP13_1NG178700 [Panicum virgatum]
MASRAASEATLLVMVLLLPLRLLSHALRPRFSHPSAAALLTAAALVSAICAVPDAGARAGIATSADAESDALRSEIEALRLKVAQLESLLEENTNTLNSKSSILEEDNKLIEAMERDIQLLMDGPESTKDSKIKSYSAGNIKSMEDEVQQLQQEVSKINKNSDTIESLARDTERRVETLGSEVKKYAADINLNDIFLRGASYARSCFSHTYKESSSFLQEINRYYHEAYRFRKAIRRQYIPDTDRPDVFFLGGSVSRSSIAIPYNQFKFFISSTQKFHHKVQVFLHDALESNRYSRGLANEPVTFIMAYLLVVSPMWIAWFLYSTRLGSKK